MWRNIISHRILEALSRFENIEDLSKEAIHRILINDALRQRLSTESDEANEIEIVREALIEEERKAQVKLRAAESQIANQDTTIKTTEDKV